MESGKTALITGATSGIGAEFAKQLAGMGYNLIITGRRKKEIQKKADEISKEFNVKTDIIIAELSEESGREKVVKSIRKTPDLKMLVNNAGFGHEGFFAGVDFSIHEQMLNVHSLAVMRLTYEAIPVLIKNNGGAIINISSMCSRLFLPGQSIYNSTKAFVTAFTETLHMEYGDNNIVFQALCPGFTRTDFHSKMGYGLFDLPDAGVNRWMTPEQVVKYSLKSLGKGKVLCVPGFLNRISYGMPRIMPRKAYYKMMSGMTDLKKVFNVK